MNELEIHQLFNDSLQACLSDDDFLKLFYDRFIASSPTVAKKFSNTEMINQRRMLMKSLMVAQLAYKDPEPYLSKLALSHSARQLDIAPELYELWLGSLIETIKGVDPNFSENVEMAWRALLQPGIDFMISKYRD